MKKRFNFSINSIVLIGVFLIFASSCEKDEEITKEESGSFTDARDGNIYQTVTIGKQVWMAENLKYLPGVIGSNTGSETTPYCYVFDYQGTNVSEAKATSNYSIYGVLYNWSSAMNEAASSTANPSGVQGVCPTGWHIPSDAEWQELETYLADNGYNFDGTTGGGGAKIAKSMASAIGWKSLSNTGVVGNNDFPDFRNKSGFTGLAGGARYDFGEFFDTEYAGYWWSATEFSSSNGNFRGLYYHQSNLDSYNYKKEHGFSVRCIRD